MTASSSDLHGALGVACSHEAVSGYSRTALAGQAAGTRPPRLGGKLLCGVVKLYPDARRRVNDGPAVWANGAGEACRLARFVGMAE